MPFVAYKITHLESGKVYVGVTTQRRPEVRWRHHVNVGRRGLGAAIKKYGEDAFSFEVFASSWNEASLLLLETALIQQEGALSPGGYNLNIGGKGTLGASDETKRLIGEANRRRVWTEESKAKLSAHNTGIKMSASHREKRAAYMTGRRPDDATRKKLSEAAKIRCARPEWKAAIIFSNKTRHVSDETKRKIAASVSRFAATQIKNSNQMDLL